VKKKKKRGWRPNKNTKAMLWFDVKAGKWYGDAAVMREAISAGLTFAGGIRFAKGHLETLYRVAKEELGR